MESKKKTSQKAAKLESATPTPKTNKKPRKPRKKKVIKEADVKKALSSLETVERPFNAKLFSNVMEEFLHSFIVIGYTQNGDPVALTGAKDQQQMDALHTSLQRFIAMFMAGGGPPGSEEVENEE